MKCISVSVFLIMAFIFECSSIKVGSVNQQKYAKESHSSPIQFFASTVDGLEPILAKEITTLSEVTNVNVGKCGVSFRGTVRTGMEALLWLRTSLKLMELIVEGDNLETRDDLYGLCASVNWAGILTHENTLKCDNVLGQAIPRDLSHTHFNALTIKNAIIDQFRDKNSLRPSVNTEDPDLALMLYLHRGKGILYRVWSGESSMHKRGYRDVVHMASLRETTAAALVTMSQWNPQTEVLCDPMCGSGTIAIEAALMAANTAPGLLKYGRSTVGARGGAGGMLYPCPLAWVDGRDDTRLWKDIVDEAEARDKRHELNVPGRGSFIALANDVHPEALQLALRSAGQARVHRMIHFSCKDAAVYRPPIRPDVVLTNPPWDRRLDGAEEAWDKLGQFMQGAVWGSSASSSLSPSTNTPTPSVSGGGSGEGEDEDDDDSSNYSETVPSCVGSRAAAAKALQVKATRKPQKWEDKGAAKRHTRIGPMLWALTGDTEVSKSLPVRHSSSFKIRAAGVDMKLLGYEQPL